MGKRIKVCLLVGVTFWFALPEFVLIHPLIWVVTGKYPQYFLFEKIINDYDK